MKTIISKYWLVLMVLVSMTLLSACSSDDDATNPVFPQVQTIAGNAGDEFDFTFEANENWSLASSAIWCKMVQGEDGKEAFVLNGTAGKQTIKVKLTDDDASKKRLWLSSSSTWVARRWLLPRSSVRLMVTSSKCATRMATLSTRLWWATRTSSVSLPTTSSS